MRRLVTSDAPPTSLDAKTYFTPLEGVISKVGPLAADGSLVLLLPLLHDMALLLREDGLDLLLDDSVTTNRQRSNLCWSGSQVKAVFLPSPR